MTADGGSWVGSFFADGSSQGMQALPLGCVGTARAIAIDSQQYIAVALEDLAFGEVRYCGFPFFAMTYTYASNYPAQGSFEVDDIVASGANLQLAYEDNTGANLLLANPAMIPPNNTGIPLPDQDFTEQAVSQCRLNQMAVGGSSAYLSEVCYSSTSAQVSELRGFDFTGAANTAVQASAPVAPAAGGFESWAATGLDIDPASVNGGPHAWIVGQTTRPVAGFLAQLDSFGPNATPDAVADGSSVSLDAIAFSPAGGMFAVLAVESQSTLTIRTYPAGTTWTTSRVLGNPGPSSAALGQPVPRRATGSRPGHQLAWANATTVFFITTEGLFQWNPNGP
jgi:hypothetical protein